MPKLVRVGPLGMALTAWDVWRRIPPKQRKLLLAQARAHGPTLAKHGSRIAKTAYDARRKKLSK